MGVDILRHCGCIYMTVEVRRLCIVGGRYIGHKEVRHNCGKGTFGE